VAVVLGRITGFVRLSLPYGLLHHEQKGAQRPKVV